MQDGHSKDVETLQADTVKRVGQCDDEQHVPADRVHEDDAKVGAKLLIVKLHDDAGFGSLFTLCKLNESL